MKKAITNEEELYNNSNSEIIIKEPQRHFIILYETIYKNYKLTALEMFLLVKLISKAPTFKPTIESLKSILHTGKKALLEAIKNLKEYGYLEIVKHGAKSEWIIRQEPLYLEPIKQSRREDLINALLRGELNISQLEYGYKKHLISEQELIKIREEYYERLTKILKTKWTD